MEFDLIKASEKLSKLNLNISFENVEFNVLWFRVMIQQGDWVITRHMHSSFEFHYIKSGACRVILDDDEFVAREGEFYVAIPGVHHEQRESGDRGHVEYCLNCDIKVLDNRESENKYIFDILSNAKCKAYQDTCGVIRLFENALTEAFSGKLGYYQNIQHFVCLMMNLTARTICTDSIEYDVPKKINSADSRFEMINRFINDNISNNINVSDIASFLFLSEKQLGRVIKKMTGMGTRAYLIQIKLRKAKEYLGNTNFSQKQISDLLGFTSEYYFNQFFSKHEGYPPGKYRGNINNV